MFDTRYHNAEYIEKFLGRILNCVCKGLGIDEHATPNQDAPMEAIKDKKRKQEDDEESRSQHEEISPRRPGSRARSTLRERPALGNVQRPSGEKVAEDNPDELRKYKIKGE